MIIILVFLIVIICFRFEITMKYCCAIGCKNGIDATRSISFHKFPKDEEIKCQWLAKIKRIDAETGKDWQPGKQAVLCSAHFTSDDYCKQPWAMNRLKPNAVPSVFSYPVEQNRIKKASKKLNDRGSDQTSSTLIDSQCKADLNVPSDDLTLAQKLLQFQKDGYMCDTILQANDGMMKVHSIMLAAGSALFKSLLQSHPEPRENIVKFPEFELYVLEIAVQLIYTGELVVPEKYSSEETLSTVVTKLMQLGLVIPHQQQCCEPSPEDSNALKVEDDVKPIIFDEDQNTTPDSEHTNTAASPSDELDSNVHVTEVQLVISNCRTLDKSDDESSNKQPVSDSVRQSAHCEKDRVSHICEVCGKHFKRLAHLKMHVIIHSGVRPFACDHCGRAFAALCNLHRHRKIHTGDRRYLCPSCGMSFIQRNSLLDHASRHHPELVGVAIKPLLCTKCGETFVSTTKLRRHVEIEHRPRDHNVVAIEESASATDDRRMTKSQVQSANVCSVCHRKLSSRTALAYHMRRHTQETPERRFQCVACGSAFEKAYQLKNHVIHRHSGSGPHVCETCGQAFGVLSALKQHMWKHGAGLEHVCDECGKRFATSQSLQIHRLVHSDEKPHQCVECGRRYRQLAHLQHHQLTHTGVKPYRCEMCSKAYKSRFDLRVHCERVHQVVIPVVKHRRKALFSNGLAEPVHTLAERRGTDDGSGLPRSKASDGGEESTND